jgi:hypothetical protein
MGDANMKKFMSNLGVAAMLTLGATPGAFAKTAHPAMHSVTVMMGRATHSDYRVMMNNKIYYMMSADRYGSLLENCKAGMNC